MADKLSVSFIIPVLNSPNLAARLLMGIESYSNPNGWEAIFVDNASGLQTRNSLKWLQSNRPYVKLIQNEENVGFGPANNQGAKEASGDILVFTQPDVVVFGDIVTLCRTAVNGDLQGARLLKYDTGWNRFGEQIVPYLEGWFITCSKSTWEAIGGFDERYVPADFEDIDLSYAAVQKGYKLSEIAFSVSHPVPGSSAWNQVAGREAITVKNRELFKQKWGLK